MTSAAEGRSTWLAGLGKRRWRQVVYGHPCNNGCIFCYETDPRLAGSQSSRPALPELEATFRQWSPGDGAVFGLGEPGLLRELPQALEAARRAGLAPWLLSNGRLFSVPTYLTALAPLLDGVVVALHGTERLHEALTRVPGSYRQTLTGLRQLAALPAEQRPRLVVQTVLSAANSAAFANLGLELEPLALEAWVIRRERPLGRVRERDLSTEPLYGGSQGLLTLLQHAERLPPVLVEDVPPCLLGDALLQRIEEHGSAWGWRQSYYSGRWPWTPWLTLEHEQFARVPACASCRLQIGCPGFPADLAELPTAQGVSPLRPGSSPWVRPELPSPSLTAADVEHYQALSKSPAAPDLLERASAPQSRAALQQAPAWRRRWEVPLEYLALSHGLKPAYRFVIPLPEVERRAQHYTELGLAVTLLDEDVFVTPASEFLYGEGFEERFGERASWYLERQSAAPPKPMRLLLVGADPLALARLAELERAERAAWRTQGGLPGSAEEIGRLLGFPECCRRAFLDIGTEQNRNLTLRALRHSERCDWRLNQLSPGVVSLISWAPCRYDCAASLAFASALFELLQQYSPTQAAEIREYLARPRLFWDMRRQLVVDGRIEPDGCTVRPRAVWTEGQLDPQPDSLALDLLFLADSEPWRSAQSWVRRERGWELRGGSAPGQHEDGPRPPLWLPFG